MSVDAPVIAVNGRFTTQPVTGVQRYAKELVERLAVTSGWTIRLLLPPDRVVELGPGDGVEFDLDDRWWGAKGHLWEQTKLPRLVRKTGADLLLSPAGWGPLAMRRQLPVIFDLHPLSHPEYFVSGFVRWARLAMPFLTHVPRRVAVISGHVRDQVVDRLHVDPGRIDVVPPAVGPPFRDRPSDDLAARDRRTCLFVGGDKAQKNLAFILGFWPELHARTGLELVVTERAVGSRIEGQHRDPVGMRRVVDPTDEELAGLYEDALCLLWPSLAEGYGIPLLEAMACGTPFLSADVGAARELAIVAEQVQPRHADAWVEQLVIWHDQGVDGLARQGIAVAREATWERSAGALVAALQRSLSLTGH
ncbi:MAG TPA: glycosyltransferase family 1 protein [Acidimicrobiales bacterium]|nr:glycosyltransferase family 1 protein [Acidimicrobiales bacterium]